jgi:gluconokinase
MAKRYVLGLDIGTTSAKAVIFERNGKVMADAEKEYPLYHPHPGWVEQDPDEIAAAAAASIKLAIEKGHIDAADLIGVGFSSAMHSLICVDNEGQPLSASITWADGRSVGQAEQLKQADGLDFYLRTGTPIHPMSPFLKLLWMKENNFEPYKKADKFISIKEYLLLRWFNVYEVDYSVASSSGMFDVHKLVWDTEALHKAGISEEQLSVPVPPTRTYQGIKSEVAEAMGIPTELPFVIGGSDGPLANLGIGAIEPEDIAITIGTSGAIRRMISKPATDPQQEVFCYAFSDDLWVMGGATNNGGIVFRWLRDILGGAQIEEARQAGKDVYDLLTDLAKQVKPGSEGLLFLPFLNGERAPVWDANARGSYIGLSSIHTGSHLIRSGLEGVIFNMFQISQTLERLSGPSQSILASGGFARSPLWLQILADLFNKEVLVPESHQSSAWGACWTALYALNEVKSYTAIKNSIPMQESYKPNEQNALVYNTLYQTYKDLYQALQPSLQALSKFQQNK